MHPRVLPEDLRLQAPSALAQPQPEVEADRLGRSLGPFLRPPLPGGHRRRRELLEITLLPVLDVPPGQSRQVAPIPLRRVRLPRSNTRDIPETLLEFYSVPSIFPDDYLSYLGAKRPQYRWLLVGPQRSGSMLHIDPYETSAWNTLLVGRKLWIMFPPDADKTLVTGNQLELFREVSPVRWQRLRLFHTSRTRCHLQDQTLFVLRPTAERDRVHSQRVVARRAEP